MPGRAVSTLPRITLISIYNIHIVKLTVDSHGATVVIVAEIEARHAPLAVELSLSHGRGGEHKDDSGENLHCNGV